MINVNDFPFNDSRIVIGKSIAVTDSYDDTAKNHSMSERKH